MLFVQRAKKPCGFYEICRHKYDKDVIVIVVFGEFRVESYHKDNNGRL